MMSHLCNSIKSKPGIKLRGAEPHCVEAARQKGVIFECVVDGQRVSIRFETLTAAGEYLRRHGALGSAPW